MGNTIIPKLKTIAKKYPLSKQEGSYSPLLTASPCNYGVLDKVWYDEYPFSFDFLCWAYGENRGLVMFRQDKYYEVTRHEFNNYLKQKSDHPPASERFLRSSKICESDYKRYRPDFLKKADNKNLIRIILSAISLCGILQRDSLFVEALDEEISKEFYKSLGGKEEDFEVFFLNSSLPAFDSFKIRREKIFLKIFKHKKAISPYDVQWMYTDYFTAKNLDETGRIIIRQNPRKIQTEIAAHDKQLRKVRARQAKFLNETGGKLRKLAQFIQLSMYIRDYRKDYFAKAQTIAYNAAAEFFSRLGLNPRNCVYTFYTDYTSGLVNDTNFGKIINGRKKGFLVMTETKPTRHFLEAGDYDKMKRALMLIHDGSQREAGGKMIQGNVACRGVVRGRVKIILNSKDFSKFKSGDILVASMTRPEYIPVIKKAAAIITDEGGITCHAAIISRELNIPCIIGTRNATRALKDGQLVEVDADKGEVKIIKN